MYGPITISEPLSQGDIVDDCPLFAVESAVAREPIRYSARVVVLTQACDLAYEKSTRVLVAVTHEAADVVAQGILKASFIRDTVRRGLVFGWYFLPAAPSPIPIAESIVDLRDLHTVSRNVLEELIRSGKRVCRIQTPYREHLAQHFATTYSRIGLPEPYETQE